MLKKRFDLDLDNSDSFYDRLIAYFEDWAHIIAAISFVVIFFGIAFLLFYSSSNRAEFEPVPICGDGTFYETCSLKKPFYCSDGALLEKASICGCSNNLTKSGDFCASKYGTSPKEAKLKYVLRGEEHEIDFTLYKGMYDYLQTLSDEITYKDGERLFRTDFKLMNINEPNQRELLISLAAKIQNITPDENDQMRIAVSLVQNMEWGNSNRSVTFSGVTLPYSRHPYEVLYDSMGVCGEKSELLALLLKELNYGVAIFYSQEENHESVGIKCPVEKSWQGTGYCFVETTGNSIITDSSIEYTNGLRLTSKPEVMIISDGKSLPEELYEYDDAEYIMGIRDDLSNGGKIANPFRLRKYGKLTEKYGLQESYNAG